MDEQRFDSLAKTLAGEVNRRRVLRGAAAGLAAAVGLRGLRGVSAGTGKVGICHLTGNGSYVYITVSTSAVPAHEAHGDTVTDLTDVGNCGACGNACDAPENASAVCTDDGCDFACNAGYQLNEAGDGCVAVGPCGACITSPVPQCYWMENFSGNSCWVPSPSPAPDEAACIALDSCSPGGGGQSGGGCYKWDTTNC